MSNRLRRWAGRTAVLTGVTALALASAAIPAHADVYWGIDSCAQGYVWREARSTDHVCVPPATRDRTWADNAAAPTRWVNGPYGPHTCISGFVWREAFVSDDVCTTPDMRTLAAQDNALAAGRVALADEYHCTWVGGLGSDTVCIRLGRDLFGFSTIRVRYRHFSGPVNTVQAGVIWSTNRGENGVFSSQIFTGSSELEWPAAGLFQYAGVGTCATANAFISSPPNDPNGQFFSARVDVCRTR
jgi:hypothetical protein